MILPRPIPNPVDYDKLVKFIWENFKLGEEFVLSAKPQKYKFLKIEDDPGGIVVAANIGQGKRVERIGILRFYSQVTKDIGILFPMEKLSATRWLMSGIDGELNIDRLCKAWSMNGELLPRNDDRGNALRAILAESNQAIIQSDEKEAFAAVEMIDEHLVKYGTYLNDLTQRSGLAIKQAK